MKTSKRILAIAMIGVLAASMAVPAFAGSAHVHRFNANSVSSLAANEANVKYVINHAEDAVQEAKNVVSRTEKRIANSKAAAAQANATIELAKEELAGTTVVVAPVITSGDAAALANAAYAAAHGTN